MVDTFRSYSTSSGKLYAAAVIFTDRICRYLEFPTDERSFERCDTLKFVEFWYFNNLLLPTSFLRGLSRLLCRGRPRDVPLEIKMPIELFIETKNATESTSNSEMSQFASTTNSSRAISYSAGTRATQHTTQRPKADQGGQVTNPEFCFTFYIGARQAGEQGNV